jgi:hypothetical protein
MRDFAALAPMMPEQILIKSPAALELRAGDKRSNAGRAPLNMERL